MTRGVGPSKVGPIPLENIGRNPWAGLSASAEHTDDHGAHTHDRHPARGSQFLQTPEVVYILFEYSNVWVPIAMNKLHSPDPDPTWWGESVGHYEGDTLVVDSIGFNDKTWLDRVGPTA